MILNKIRIVMIYTESDSASRSLHMGNVMYNAIKSTDISIYKANALMKMHLLYIQTRLVWFI